MRIALLSMLLITFLLGGWAGAPTVSQASSPERSHSGSFGKWGY
jgi:hypothetical protein